LHNSSQITSGQLSSLRVRIRRLCYDRHRRLPRQPIADAATESARQKLIAAALYLLPVLLAAAAFFELFQVARLSLFYSGTGIIGDEPLYFAMGRGLLNGLHFYIDLFETKPPMVFWLAALSLLTTGGDSLYRFVQAAGLTAIPIALFAFTIQVNRPYPLLVRLLTGGAALLFGATIASFAVTRSVGYQTEGFGIVPSSFALLLFAWKPESRRLRLWRIGAIALCLCLAVLIKEPFALAILGGFVLLASSKSDWTDALKAAVIGGLLWLFVLVVTGVAHGYFAVYLPEMFSGRVTQNVIYHYYAADRIFVVHSPLWMRGLNIIRLFQDMMSSPYRVVPLFPFLALALGVLFLTHQASIGDDDRHWGWFALGVATMAFVASSPTSPSAWDSSLSSCTSSCRPIHFLGNCASSLPLRHSCASLRSQC